MKHSDVKRKINLKAAIAVAVCLALLVGAVSYDFLKGRSEFTSAGVAMGTVINLKLYGSDGEETAQKIKAEINAVENSLLSRYSSSSDVARINAAAGSAVSVSSDVIDIISTCVDISKDSGGVFDITLGKITALWDFGGENQRLPSKDEIAPLLSDADSGQIIISGHNITIGKNQALDLGAVGKGAACDRIKLLLDGDKTRSAVISVGGSLLIYGGRSFSIGIANPEDISKSVATLKLSDVCVSTSGNYEKFFVQDGKTYHHILDATTGYPADSRLSSVTVVCESGTVSDALSTACYILGYNASLPLLEKYEAQAAFIFKDKTVRITDGLQDSFELTDESYVMAK